MKKITIENVQKCALIKYGFNLNDDVYYYEKNIVNNKFKVIIEIKDEMHSKVIDNQSLEEYFLVDVDTALGNFVGQVRNEYENILNDVISKCTIKERYHFKQTREVLKYLKKTYNDIPEYLWKNDDKTGAVRNKNNSKWYLVIMVINASKLGLKIDKEIEIIDIRYQKGKTDDLINHQSIFPAWHMNKKSWITIVLDGSLDNEILYSLIDNSYELSFK